MPVATSLFATLLIKVLAVAMLVIAAIMLIAGVKLYGTFGGGVILMGGTLALVWNGIGGVIMYRARDKVRAFILRQSMSPKKVFIIFATVLALTEEAVTTTLTNLASVFGNADSFITSTRNYLELVLYHSVIVFVPMFIVWAWMLGRYRFSPGAVFILLGIDGIFAEALSGGGVNAFIAAPFWIFVYGLMVFLPAYSFDFAAYPTAKSPRWYHYLLMPPSCFIAAGIMAIIVGIAAPHLPHLGTTLTVPH